MRDWRSLTLVFLKSNTMKCFKVYSAQTDFLFTSHIQNPRIFYYSAVTTELTTFYKKKRKKRNLVFDIGCAGGRVPADNLKKIEVYVGSG